MAVTWYKEGVRVLPSPRIQMRGAVVEITDVTYEDSGVYVCVLRGSKDPVRNFTITVAGEDTARRSDTSRPQQRAAQQSSSVFVSFSQTR